MSKKVYVGMSGGVDSSVTAALLKSQGYEVTGVYMKNWAKDLPGFVCPWREDLADAKRVAVQLGIDFKIYDFQKQYKQKVVDYMIHEYEAGHTPNPDIMCNQEVKFKLFLETAIEDGADLIATGHYVRITKSKKQIAKSSLLQAQDKTKDQSYFLYRISQEALSKTLFPLGEMTKVEVRKKAKKLGLVTAAKKDSVGICFVGQIGIKDFLSNYVVATPGPIIEKSSGKIIGQHDGAIFYTIGQRHGLDVGGGLPYYVIGKNMAKNTVYVTTDLNDAGLWKKDFMITSTHWINEPPQENKNYHVRTRHLGKLVNGKIKKQGQDWTILLNEPQRALAPGQSAVIYDGEGVLGGGLIVEIKNRAVKDEQHWAIDPALLFFARLFVKGGFPQAFRKNGTSFFDRLP
jgi:tRNA-specific 2-thiouridylase